MTGEAQTILDNRYAVRLGALTAVIATAALTACGSSESPHSIPISESTTRSVPSPSETYSTLSTASPQGPAVAQLQQLLHGIGCDVSPVKPNDSPYGPKTVLAVKMFQHNKGIPETGIADSATQKLLNEPNIGASHCGAPIAKTSPTASSISSKKPSKTSTQSPTKTTSPPRSIANSLYNNYQH